MFVNLTTFLDTHLFLRVYEANNHTASLALLEVFAEQIFPV